MDCLLAESFQSDHPHPLLRCSGNWDPFRLEVARRYYYPCSQCKSSNIVPRLTPGWYTFVAGQLREHYSPGHLSRCWCKERKWRFFRPFCFLISQEKLHYFPFFLCFF